VVLSDSIPHARRSTFSSLIRPPVSLSTRQWRLVIALVVLSATTGYQGSVTTQAITFVADEFGADKRQQGNALSVIRFDIVLTILIMKIADRVGRRRTLITTAIVGPLLTALCSAATSLWLFTVMQVIGRGFVTASAVLLSVLLVEELPDEARAWGAAVAVAAAAAGSLVVLGVLPIAGQSITSWRILYLFPIIGLIPIFVVRSSIHESRRFSDLEARRAHGYRDSSWVRHTRRIIVITMWVGLMGVFITPARQFANDYLREQRGLTAGQLSLFNIVTNIPATAGLFIGGTVSDRYGRKLTCGFGLLGYAVATAVTFITGGATMWAAALVASLAGAFALPSLSVMVSEMFPTELRSRASGYSTGVNRLGGVIGLQLVGRLADRFTIGTTVACMSVFLIIGTLIMMTGLPETSHRTLEELTEDTAEVSPTSPALA
jgi:MFS family permease